MAVKKAVAAPAGATIPETASGAGELETSLTVTAHAGADEKSALAAAAAAKEARKAGLAKARAVRTAKLAAAKAAAEAEAEAEAEAQSVSRVRTTSIAQMQAAIAAEAKADRRAFGEIKEVARVVPTAEEYIRVEIPLTDLFDHGHPGVQLNRHKFEPGKIYLLRGDVALEVKKRLAMFHDEQVRLLRPNADRKALNDVNRGSQWTSRGGNSIVPLGKLEDVAVASDEKIYTIDF